ncbi:MAG: DnaJ C-terminal domain-containing protein, partial [Actinomycetota bacterium]|nr:DnaJ C-terminal domain-containing protein [Actinomycetota bacterium]
GMMAVQTTCHMCEGKGVVRVNPCRPCSGTGTQSENVDVSIRIPEGIHAGAQLRVADKGDWGPGGFGDLMVRIHVKPDDRFRRVNDDIHSQVRLKPSEFLGGCTIIVETLRGEKTVTVPPCVEPGSIIQMDGLGSKNIKTKRIGNHNIEVMIDMPRSLTQEQTEKIAELRRCGL